MWTEEEYNYLQENYHKYSNPKLSEIMGKSISDIRNTASKNKIKKSLLGISSEIFKNKQLQTPSSAYILGFLWADGWIRYRTSHSISINVECVEEDLRVIEHVFDSTGFWGKGRRERINRKPQMRFFSSNTELGQWLVSKNFLNKSSESANLLINEIRNDLLHYFFRGYFDGDGCFYFHEKRQLRQASIAGAFGQDLEFFCTVLDNLEIPYKQIQRSQKTKRRKQNDKSSVVRFGGRESIKKFGDYIYQGEQFGLNRKKDKWLQIIT